MLILTWKNTKIVWSLQKGLKPFYGTIMQNSTLVDGKVNKTDQDKKLAMVSKSSPINISTKANLWTVKSMVQESWKISMATFMMVSGLKVSKMGKGYIMTLPPKLYTKANGRMERKMASVF